MGYYGSAVLSGLSTAFYTGTAHGSIIVYDMTDKFNTVMNQVDKHSAASKKLASTTREGSLTATVDAVSRLRD